MKDKFLNVQQCLVSVAIVIWTTQKGRAVTIQSWTLTLNCVSSGRPRPHTGKTQGALQGFWSHSGSGKKVFYYYHLFLLDFCSTLDESLVKIQVTECGTSSMSK